MKKLLSIFLVFALFIGIAAVGAASAFAENEEEESAAESAIPTVYLGGYGMELYLFDSIYDRWDPVLYDAIFSVVEELPAVLKALVLDIFLHPLTALRFRNRLADALSDLCMDNLGILSCDENGDSIHPVTNTFLNDEQFEAPEWYEGDDWKFANEYEFNFDWRLDPMQSARKLDAFIQKVKEATGSGTVHLYALSFGGVICCAYLEQFGTKDLESLFLFQSAHGGMTMAEELAQKKFAVSAKGLGAFIGWEQKAWYKVLKYTGLLRFAEWLLNTGLRRIRDRFYEKAVVPLLVQMPGTWGFITDDFAFENAKQLLLTDTDRYAGLIAKIDDYHYRVGNRSNEILREAADEIKLALMCGYNLAPIPLGGTFLYQSDFMIGTARASGGAVCADYGKALPKEYVQANQDGHNHMSDDRVIDASTCALPEQTWFIKDLEHFYTYDGWGMYDWFLGFSGQPTVWSDLAFPQFRGIWD